MNIDGLGKKTARQLVEKGLVANVADLYTLSLRDLRQLEGFFALTSWHRRPISAPPTLPLRPLVGRANALSALWARTRSRALLLWRA